MNPQAIFEDLISRGIRIWAEGGLLKLDAPLGALTDEDKANLAAAKPQLMAALMPKPGTCLDCGGDLDLQDRSRDVWWCGACRLFSDESGRLITPVTIPKPITLDDVEAKQLLGDLVAAGCGFTLDGFDGQELRLTSPGRMNLALWERFLNSGTEFQKLAHAVAESLLTQEEVSEWIH